MRRTFTLPVDGEPVSVEADVTISGWYPDVDLVQIECRDPASMADIDPDALRDRIIDILRSEP